MSGIFWLASYPKSGNTWLRAFLTNYLRESDEPADINELDGGWTASLRGLFEEIVGIESATLTEKQIAHYRPLVYEQMAAQSTEQTFIKIHDAYTRNAQGKPLFSPRATAGVIYLIRNPLDVAVSFAHHRDEPIDETVRFMGNHDAVMVKASDATEQLPQPLLSWSKHVCSWVDEPNLNLLTVRYEDMLAQPAAVFTEIVRFVGLAENTNQLEKAIAFSSFAQLQSQEAAHGFAEKQPTAPSFFRQGRIGSWREQLTAPQVQQIITDHRTVMQRFDYLTTGSEIIF